MAYWLLKTEPGTYSFADLQKERRTAWSGVTNPAALKNMRAMAKGDELLIYHTGDEKSVVGLARVIKAAYPDPHDSNEKHVVVDIEAVRSLRNPVSLSTIKSDKRFAGWDLVRIGRLSVVPTSPELFAIVLQLSGGK